MGGDEFKTRRTPNTSFKHQDCKTLDQYMHSTAAGLFKCLITSIKKVYKKQDRNLLLTMVSTGWVGTNSIQEEDSHFSHQDCVGVLIWIIIHESHTSRTFPMSHY